MTQRLRQAPLSERKRKAPGMVKEIHGVLISNKRVHLYGPRFADVGVHHNLRTMFADMGPVQVDSSDDETSAKQESLPMKSGLAEETIDVLETLEAELEARMSRDGELSTCIIHMGKALKVVRDMLRPARAELQRSSVCVDGSAGAFDFDSSDVARVNDKVIHLLATLHR